MISPHEIADAIRTNNTRLLLLLLIQASDDEIRQGYKFAKKIEHHGPVETILSELFLQAYAPEDTTPEALEAAKGRTEQAVAKLPGVQPWNETVAVSLMQFIAINQRGAINRLFSEDAIKKFVRELLAKKLLKPIADAGQYFATRERLVVETRDEKATAALEEKTRNEPDEDIILGLKCLLFMYEQPETPAFKAVLYLKLLDTKEFLSAEDHLRSSADAIAFVLQKVGEEKASQLVEDPHSAWMQELTIIAKTSAAASYERGEIYYQYALLTNKAEFLGLAFTDFKNALQMEKIPNLDAMKRLLEIQAQIQKQPRQSVQQPVAAAPVEAKSLDVDLEDTQAEMPVKNVTDIPGAKIYLPIVESMMPVVEAMNILYVDSANESKRIEDYLQAKAVEQQNEKQAKKLEELMKLKLSEIPAWEEKQKSAEMKRETEKNKDLLQVKNILHFEEALPILLTTIETTEESKEGKASLKLQTADNTWGYFFKLLTIPTPNIPSDLASTSQQNFLALLEKKFGKAVTGQDQKASISPEAESPSLYIPSEYLVKMLQLPSIRQQFNLGARSINQQIVVINSYLGHLVTSQLPITENDRWLLLFFKTKPQVLAGLDPEQQLKFLTWYRENENTMHYQDKLSNVEVKGLLGQLAYQRWKQSNDPKPALDKNYPDLWIAIADLKYAAHYDKAIAIEKLAEIDQELMRCEEQGLPSNLRSQIIRERLGIRKYVAMYFYQQRDLVKTIRLISDTLTLVVPESKQAVTEVGTEAVMPAEDKELEADITAAKAAKKDALNLLNGFVNESSPHPDIVNFLIRLLNQKPTAIHPSWLNHFFINPAVHNKLTVSERIDMVNFYLDHYESESHGQNRWPTSLVWDMQNICKPTESEGSERIKLAFNNMLLRWFTTPLRDEDNRTVSDLLSAYRTSFNRYPLDTVKALGIMLDIGRTCQREENYAQNRSTTFEYFNQLLALDKLKPDEIATAFPQGPVGNEFFSYVDAKLEKIRTDNLHHWRPLTENASYVNASKASTDLIAALIQQKKLPIDVVVNRIINVDNPFNQPDCRRLLYVCFNNYSAMSLDSRHSLQTWLNHQISEARRSNFNLNFAVVDMLAYLTCIHHSGEEVDALCFSSVISTDDVEKVFASNNFPKEHLDQFQSIREVFLLPRKIQQLSPAAQNEYLQKYFAIVTTPPADSKRESIASELKSSAAVPKSKVVAVKKDNSIKQILAREVTLRSAIQRSNAILDPKLSLLIRVACWEAQQRYFKTHQNFADRLPQLEAIRESFLEGLRESKQKEDQTLYAEIVPQCQKYYKSAMDLLEEERVGIKKQMRTQLSGMDAVVALLDNDMQRTIAKRGIEACNTDFIRDRGAVDKLSTKLKLLKDLRKCVGYNSETKTHVADAEFHTKLEQYAKSAGGETGKRLGYLQQYLENCVAAAPGQPLPSPPPSPKR